LASAKSVFLTTNQCASTCAAHAARILGSSPRMTTEEKRERHQERIGSRAARLFLQYVPPLRHPRA